jgi:hypothetical protein
LFAFAVICTNEVILVVSARAGDRGLKEKASERFEAELDLDFLSMTNGAACKPMNLYENGSTLN